MCINFIIKKTFQKENVSIFIACTTNSWDRFLLSAEFPTARKNKEQKPCPALELSECQTHTKLGLRGALLKDKC